MADVYNIVNRAIPPNLRSVVFSQVDTTSGILLVEKSLGHPAKNVYITATNAMRVRFNVYETVYPMRKDPSIPYSDGMPLLVSGIQYHDTSVSGFVIAASSTYDNNGEFPIRDIEIQSADGDFEIYLT